ncbi:MAG: hypothetical protein LLG14_16015 [Nocardiaceae bacterium]|nr:hypothetical protein [Nocardiaceae bacterium]
MVTSNKTTFEYPIVGGLRISLQRYLQPACGGIDALPHSCGALPMLVTSHGLLAPCPDGEAFWVGLVSARGDSWTVRVEASLTIGASADAELAHVPPACGVAGLPRDDTSWWPFTRCPVVHSAPACRSLAIHARRGDWGASGAVCVELVDVEEFESLAGKPVPRLDTQAAYGGWRLP